MTRLFNRCLSLVLLFAACAKPGPVHPAGVADVTNAIVKAFASRTLTVASAQAMFGTDGSTMSDGRYWQGRSRDGLTEVVIRTGAPDASTDNAELRYQVEAGLKLADLERTLGGWTLVSSGEGSSVSFRIDDGSDQPTVVFARLFTPHPASDSPVIGVQLRRNGKRRD